MEPDTADQYRALVEFTTDLLTLVDEHGTILFKSPSIERVLGYESGELVGETVFDYIHPEDRAGVRELFEALPSSEDTVVEDTEFRFRDADGSWVWLESVASNRTVSALGGYVISSRDVTDRKEQEARLERQANRLEAFSVAFPDLAFIVDEEGRFRDVIAGHRSQEQLYREPSSFLDRTAGEVLPGEVAREFTAAVRSAIETGGMQQVEYSLELPAGERWFEARIEPLGFEIDGQPVVVAVSRDVTERRANEERLSELSAELEVLNRVVRHDIRNDMNVVTGWAQLLEDHVDEEGEDVLRRVQASGAHIVEITEIARDYVTSLMEDGATETVPISLRSAMQVELDLSRASYPDATFVVSDDFPDVAVLANEMLGSVFRNLLNNAVQHNDAENPVVTVSCAVSDEDVVVSVADNGPGVADERTEQIFGKAESGLDSTGTGIGLYLVRSLVTQYGGSVWVEDDDSGGAVFNVQLRRAG